jgi:hypothetical protein
MESPAELFPIDTLCHLRIMKSEWNEKRCVTRF